MSDGAWANLFPYNPGIHELGSRIHDVGIINTLNLLDRLHSTTISPGKLLDMGRELRADRQHRVVSMIADVTTALLTANNDMPESGQPLPEPYAIYETDKFLGDEYSFDPDGGVVIYPAGHDIDDSKIHDSSLLQASLASSVVEAQARWNFLAPKPLISDKIYSFCVPRSVREDHDTGPMIMLPNFADEETTIRFGQAVRSALARVTEISLHPLVEEALSDHSEKVTVNRSGYGLNHNDPNGPIRMYSEGIESVAQIVAICAANANPPLNLDRIVRKFMGLRALERMAVNLPSGIVNPLATLGYKAKGGLLPSMPGGDNAYEQFMNNLKVNREIQFNRRRDRTDLLLGAVALWQSTEIKLQTTEKEIFSNLIHIAFVSRIGGDVNATDAIAGTGCPAAYTRSKNAPIKFALQLLEQAL